MNSEVQLDSWNLVSVIIYCNSLTISEQGEEVPVNVCNNQGFFKALALEYAYKKSSSIHL